MGLESYLFSIEFAENISEQELIKLFNGVGLKQAKQNGLELNERREYFHELLTEDGIIETRCFLPPGEKRLSQFFLRFSICSPPKIVDRTFELLATLNTIMPIRVKDLESLSYLHLGPKGRPTSGVDVENSSYIPLDVDLFKQNPDGILKRELLLDENRNHSVIRGGADTIAHLEEKNWFNQFFGWIFK